MDGTEKFFISGNRIEHPENLDYSRVNEYISAAEAFARSTYQSIYIIDYFLKKFLYVSPNPMVLCELTPEQMMEINYRFYLEYVPTDEQDMLVTLNKVGFDFYNNIPVEERKEWYIQYDFHVINNGKKVLINHKLTPLALTPDGRVWLALCVVAASTHSGPGQIEIHRSGSPEYFEFNLVTHRWDKKRMPMLTDIEKSIITLSIQGHTMTEIADMICLAPDTVKKYRQKIFEKLEVRNISEAIVAAINNKIL